MEWALPPLTEATYGSEATVEALAELREFLRGGDVTTAERIAPSILEACQTRLENEMPLLKPLLGVLMIIANRFTHCFEPHFADIVDLLLGWALDPEHPEADRRLIVDNFLEFQSLWAGNLSFSLSLLMNFLGDMEMLAYEHNPLSSKQLRRLLALASCFVSVLHATTSGLEEAAVDRPPGTENVQLGLTELLTAANGNDNDENDLIMRPAREMFPRVLKCFLVVGQNWRDFRWLNEACRCLTLFAGILKERFSEFYTGALDILLQGLVTGAGCGPEQHNTFVGLSSAPVTAALNSKQVQALLQVNWRLLEYQGFEVPAAAVSKLLEGGSPFANLRLYPSCVVRGTVAATYFLLLQHGSEQVATEVTRCLEGELEGFRKKLFNSFQDSSSSWQSSNNTPHTVVNKYSEQEFSDQEVVTLLRFDLLLLLGRSFLKQTGPLELSQIDKSVVLPYMVKRLDLHIRRFMDLKAFILVKQNPFEDPLQWHPNLQLLLWQVLHWQYYSIDDEKLSHVQILGGSQNRGVNFGDKGVIGELSPNWMALNNFGQDSIFECSLGIAFALHSYASIVLKLEVLSLICKSSEGLSQTKVNQGLAPGEGNRQGHYDSGEGWNFVLTSKLLDILLISASNREPRVRANVALAFELFLQANIVKPAQFQPVALVALEQLGDPEPSLQAAYWNLVWAYAPAALWTRGWSWTRKYSNKDVFVPCTTRDCQRHILRSIALKHSGKQLRSQQLVWILDFLSQRGQILPSHWLQRMVQNCCCKPKLSVALDSTSEGDKHEWAIADGMEYPEGECCDGDVELLREACASNNVTAAWWAVQEASRYCVTVRLRTHLGGPTQTFAALERMLLDVPQLCQTNGVPREGVLGNKALFPSAQFLAMRLLLEFVEDLKKEIFNAYEGALVMPCAPTSSTLFFRANRKVCEEWFARIGEALMNASSAIQCHAGTYLHATLRLQDLRGLAVPVAKDAWSQQVPESTPSFRTKLQHDLARVMRHASLALCRLHEADCLLGLQLWVTSTFPSLVVEDGLTISKPYSSIGPFAWLSGLVFQARGQYEKALAHYSHLLELEETMAAMGADGIQFTIARTIESFVAIGDWESLDIWVQELQCLRAKHAGKSYCGALTTAGNDMNAIHALARFDVGDTQGAWAYLDLTPQSSSEPSADPWQALYRSEQMLLQAMLRPDTKKKEADHEIGVAKAMVEDGLLVAMLDGLLDAAPFVVQLECIQAFESSRNAEAQEKRVTKSRSPGLSQVLGPPLDSMHQDCLLWLKLLRVYRVTSPGTSITLQLHQQLLRVARKLSNLKLARRLLEGFHGSQAAAFDQHINIHDQHDVFQEGFRYEGILLLYAEEKWVDAIVQIWHFVKSKLVASVNLLTCEEDGNFGIAKACLKLSTWLQRRPSLDSAGTVLIAMEFEVNDSDDLDLSLFDRVDSNGRNEEGRLARGKGKAAFEIIAGAALKAGTLLCPKMAKAWFAYALWCYRYANGFFFGTKVGLSESSVFLRLLKEEMSGNNRNLTDLEIAHIRCILSRAVAGCNSEVLEALTSEGELKLEGSVERIISAMQAAASSAGSEDVDGNSPSVLLALQLQRELQAIPCALPVGPFVSELMQIWWIVRRRQVSMFCHAARGFLQYLAMSNQRHLKGHLGEQVKVEKEDCRLSSSLYVLRILLNYGVELEESLQQGLSSVPPSSWQAIIGQLFARVSSHSEPRVRKQVEGLLMASANLSPWAIVYPLLVDLNAYEGEPSEELKRLQDCLVNLHPRLVGDVKVMIAELGAITVFWDEQWLSTLQDLHSDVMRRITILREEAVRVAANATLSYTEKLRINAAKYSAIMAPVAVALERRLASTSRPPETPRESWFHETLWSPLKMATAIFKSPPVGSTSIGDVWTPFDTITAALISYQKKSTTLLSDVSPRLAVLQSSEAPLPGLEFHFSSREKGLLHVCAKTGSPVTINDLPEIVTVTAFGSQVIVLSTKTRPKKLQILGSDGCKYPYLLKGREDLRLDARIMQLLQAVNHMLQGRCKTRQRGLSVRHYSVTPISGCAGLIQWVDNLTSMYSVYKAWQQRILAAQLAGTLSTVNAPSAVATVPRPSDLYYGKIIPALKEKGLRRVISRRDWPQEVKRKVLLELIKETPRQLLHHELWCASEGLSAFRTKLEQFSGSVAVMSIVGYILGLGDRHLDNILVDFSSGDVVHIDYNVCFDKGLRLKIPEIVPFRLTHTIEAALGPTGIEGVFRANCEAVLEVLRSNKDVLLMLLQVFVWDPLVEWMRGDGHDNAAIGGEERKGMELAVSLSLFASRLQEIRVPLQEHHDQLLQVIPAAAKTLQSLLNAADRHEECTLEINRVEESKSAAVHEEVAARSLLVEATSALHTTREVYDTQAQEFEQAKGLLAEAARDLKHWVEQHGHVLDALRLGSIPDIRTMNELSNATEALSLMEAVVAAGLPLTLVPEPAQVQCREIDQELAQLTAARYKALLHAVQSLQAYAIALRRLLPVNYISSSLVHTWAQLLQVSIQQLSLDGLAMARRRAADLMARGYGDQADTIQQKYDDILLHEERLFQRIQELQEERAELEAATDPDAVQKAKDQLSATITRHLQILKTDSQSKGRSFLGLVEFARHCWKELLPRNDTLAALSNSKQMSTVDIAEKQKNYLLVLHRSAEVLYKGVGESLRILYNCVTEKTAACNRVEPCWIRQSWCLPELQEMLEKVVILSDIMVGIQQLGGSTLREILVQDPEVLGSTIKGVPEWTLRCTAWVAGVENFCNQMTGLVLPEAIKAAISHDPAVMDAFIALSQIRVAVDGALEQIVGINVQHSRLKDLESSYPEKVGEISQQQALLQVAAARGKEHLSWEEREELDSQEEACNMLLENLHQTWAQRGAQTLALKQMESHVLASLLIAEKQFDSLISIDNEFNLHLMQGKVLLAAFAQLFSGLETVDQGLMLLMHKITSEDDGLVGASNPEASRTHSAGAERKTPFLLEDQAFFVWKVKIINALLDLSIRDVSSGINPAFSFEQVLQLQTKRLEGQLQQYLEQYLGHRLIPVLLLCLTRETLLMRTDSGKSGEDDNQEPYFEENLLDQTLLLLHEYYNVHDTIRASNAAVAAMKSQVEELMLALEKLHMEAAQMEWLNESQLSSLLLHNHFLGVPNLMRGLNDGSSIEWWKREQICENLRTARTAITQSTEDLQVCEMAGQSVEEQLDRTMTWACGCPSPSINIATSGVGIPPAFHEHLLQRQQLLRSGHEQASKIVQLCGAVLAFEASRDGLLYFSIGQNLDMPHFRKEEGRMWQQTYFNMISRLESAYISFTNCAVEWQSTEEAMEAARVHLLKTSNNSRLASSSAASALGAVQGAVSNLRAEMIEAAASVAAFSKVVRSHTALTQDTGQMLEEVLAITDAAEGTHDVHTLAQVASEEHAHLTVELNRVNGLLLPLEPLLNSAAALAKSSAWDTSTGLAVTDGRNESSPGHGATILKLLHLGLRDIVPVLNDSVPMLLRSVNQLYSCLCKLVRTASSDAGVLHKALEGVGENQGQRSQKVVTGGAQSVEDPAIASFNDHANALGGQVPETGRSVIDSLYDYPGFHVTGDSWISPPDSGLTEESNSNLVIESSSQSSVEIRQQFSFMVDGNPVANPDMGRRTNMGFSSQAVEGMGIRQVHDDGSQPSIRLLGSTYDGYGEGVPSVLAAGCKMECSEGVETVPGVQLRLPHSHGTRMTSALNLTIASSISMQNRAVQEKNAYAVSVLRRVRTKLEGNEVDGKRHLAVREQLDNLLRQATSIDNLSNMYEGWTPWI